MAGKIIITAPYEDMGDTKLRIYINGIDQEVKMKQGEVQEFNISKDSTILGKVYLGKILIISSETFSVTDNNVTKLNFVINQGKWKSKLEIHPVDVIPLSDYKEDAIEKPIFEFDGGVGDKLTVYEDRVIIKHKGALNFLAMGINGDKVVYLSDITGIQYKPGGSLSGHIQFSMLGGNESKGGVLKAASDENTITFVAQKNREAQEIHEFLNKKLREIKTAKNTPIVQAAAVSTADELKKFKELLDMGVITQEEFDAKKKQLLGL